MNNFMIGLKRFFTNKNVITIVGVIVILVILYFGYSSSIKSKTNPISIPVAVEKINPQTMITSDNVTYKQVAQSMVDENVVRYTEEIIGKYTNINVTVPAGSPFYGEWLTTADNIPGNWIEMLDQEKGEFPYYLSVSVESTLGNSVLPNSYIDIYLKIADENGTIMFGRLLKNVKVLVVHDGSGNNIFADATEIGSPSKIGFAVSQDLYSLLHRAEYLGLDFVLVPHGSKVPVKDEIIVSSSTLYDYIDTRTIAIEDDYVEEPKQTEAEETQEVTE